MFSIRYILDMLLYRLKGFFADHVLDLTGVLCRGFFFDSERDEEARQYRVAFIKVFCGLNTFFGQRDVTRAVNGDVFARFENADGTADARL